jgi:hypothetical protein
MQELGLAKNANALLSMTFYEFVKNTFIKKLFLILKSTKLSESPASKPPL